MENNTNNENLTPEQLVEKLKEKLAMDRDTYSKIIEDQTESMTADSEEIEEFEEAEKSEELLEEESEADDEIFVVDLEDDEIIDPDTDIDIAEDVVSDQNNIEIVDTVDETEISKTIENIEEKMSEEDELVDERVLHMLNQIDVDEDEEASPSDVFEQESVSDEAEEVKEAVASEEIKEQRKPTVYRFRRTYPAEDDLDQTRLHSVVADNNDTDTPIDNEQTKCIDVPELQKPDLVVMQTFGATVEHVRNLYGEDVATEYENMLANTDFTERRAAEYEYTRLDQKHDIFMEFKRKMIKFKWKILVTSVICALILLLENLSLVGIKLGGMLNAEAYPVSYIMIDLQLLLICAALAFPIIKSGYTDLFMLEPTSKSITSVLVSVAVVINIASCFFEGEIVLYNFSAAIAILFARIGEVVSLKRDYMAFKVLSSDKVKNAAIVTVGTSKTPEVNVYEKLEDDEEVKVVSMQRTKFVKSFSQEQSRMILLLRIRL